MLSCLDADLQAVYGPILKQVPPLEPVLVQIARSLRNLTQQAPHGENGAKHGEGTENDVQPQELHTEPCGGAFVAVDGMAQLPGQGRQKSAFDLLVELTARLGVLTERLGDLCGGHVEVTAAGIAHASDGATVATGTQPEGERSDAALAA
jgi:hypothetical protein